MPENFSLILSEARKYGLCLTLAHQYLGQLDEKLRDAIFGNVGTIITFKVGIEDAEILQKEFYPDVSINGVVHNIMRYLSFQHRYFLNHEPAS